MTPFENKCKGDPVPSGGCANKTWSFSSTCENLGAQHPLGAKIWSSEKVNLGTYDSTSRPPQFMDQSSPDFSAERRRNCSRSSTWPILDIFIRSRDIRCRSLKSTEIRPNFACFWTIKFFGEAPLKFWTEIIKLNTLPIMVQNFAAIGRWSSEIS